MDSKKFIIHHCEVLSKNFEVEASSEEEALEIFNNKVNSGEFTFDDMEMGDSSDEVISKSNCDYYDKYSVQILQSSMDCDYKFRDFDKTKFNINDYNEVYNENLYFKNVTNYYILDNVYDELNFDHPNTMHSPSISDIIVINNQYYYVQSIGWEDITAYINK